MITIARLRVWPVLLPLAAILLVRPASARADRVDIDDPSLLGSVLMRASLGAGDPFERLITEVRYAAGLYSYVYAVATNPHFPMTFCCEGGIVSFAVTGHPLENTWGAINGSDEPWLDPEAQGAGRTSVVTSITPIHDGFLVVPERGTGSYTVMYMQSSLPPSPHGRLTYTGRVRDYDDDPEGVLRIESFHRDGALVPTPEPGTAVLFGLGLVTLALNRRATRRCRNGQTR
jgi:PEP-CTERM motif